MRKQKKRTPVDLYNPSGLLALKYRVGTHSQFKADMVEAISRRSGLKNLTTREDDDLGIALLDGWATIADVLTFYQERIANEGYLRTATEHRSVLELARTLGYELKPGVAASVPLVFMVEPSVGSPLQSRVDEGTKVMSMPGQDEKLQIFETVETIEAKATLNDLRLLQFVPQKIEAGLTELYLKGVNTNLVPGDAILIIGSERLEAADSERWAFRFLHTVTVNQDKQHTRVSWKVPLGYGGDELLDKNSLLPEENPVVFVFRQRASFFGYNAPDWKVMPESIKLAYGGGDSVGLNVSQGYRGLFSDWPGFDKISNAVAAADDEATAGKVSVHLDAVYPKILPERWVVFAGQRVGENKPGNCSTYSVALCRVTNVEVDAQSDFTLNAKTTKLELDVNEAYLCGFMRRDTVVFCVSESLEIADKPLMEPLSGNKIVLDRKVPELREGQKIIVQGKIVKERAKGVNIAVLSDDDLSDTDKFGSTKCSVSVGEVLSGCFDKGEASGVLAEAFNVVGSSPVCGLTSVDGLQNELFKSKAKKSRALKQVNVASMSLQELIVCLSDKGWKLLNFLPIVDATGVLRWRVNLSSDTGEVSEYYVVDEINPDAAASFDEEDSISMMVSEVVLIKDLSDETGTTTITLEVPDGKLCALSNVYDLASVHIYANVALATHGETVHETLGSGNSLEINQQFQLKKPPLTYVSAATSSGAKSTLKVYINDVQWQEVPSLYCLGPKDHSYSVRIEDNGDTSVSFGNGITGTRLPSGVENITASYRSGIGIQGAVAANKLTLLTKKPFGIRSVTNPIAASGAASPEKMADAKINAPSTVLTFDRIVSLKDYENFARTFLGVAKASAIAELKKKEYIIRLIVALSDAKPLGVESMLYNSLNEAIAGACARGQKVCIESFIPIYFNLDCTVYVDSAYKSEKVLTEVRAALLEAFSFAQRSFKQVVTEKEILAVVQSVPGVIYVDNILLYLRDLTMVSLADLCLTDNMLLMINPKGITLEIQDESQ